MLLGVEAPWWLLVLVAISTMAMTLAIVFYADFRGGRAHDIREGALDHPLSETIAAYAISLVVSLLLLWSFGRTEGTTAAVVAGQAIILAVLASFGAAAGRLLLGGGSSDSREGA
jgi:uncharacterized membrane protein